jgi:hypothetical protein
VLLPAPPDLERGGIPFYSLAASETGALGHQPGPADGPHWEQAKNPLKRAPTENGQAGGEGGSPGQTGQSARAGRYSLFILLQSIF